MTTADEYIKAVLDALHPSMTERDQIAAELRGSIEERLSHGRPLEDVLRDLGSPGQLAASYAAAVPMVSGRFWERAAAKAIDVAAAMAATAALCVVFLLASGGELLQFWPIGLAIAAVAGNVGLIVYTVVAERRTGQTIGKRLVGLRVAQESGIRVSLGQAVVRQLPWILNVAVIDIAFALFTDRNQRAFELLSRTRVLSVPPKEYSAPAESQVVLRTVAM